MSNEHSGNGAGDSLYVRDGIILVPYVEVEGIRTLKDSILKKAYESMVNDGTRDTVFTEKQIESFMDFVKFAKNENNLLIFFLIHETHEVAGFAWLNNIKTNYAFGHFCLFKKYWGMKTLLMGRMALSYWFNFGDGKLLDVIIGLIPTQNTRAVSYIRRLGFMVIGEIPKMATIGGEPSAMTIGYKLRGT